MEFRIIAIGRAKGEEAELVKDYLERARNAGRVHGISAIEILEIDERKAREQRLQCEALRSAIGDEFTIALDERGEVMSSPKFAEKLAQFRDQGQARINFVIGGADGLDDALRTRANFKLSFGKMVWPHMLARVMLSEQICRAVSIWSGSPYHRE